ncbi:MAG: hypothetical protein IT371_06270 [Deltaproteobacteria bacterium]|nr:hypothetical protein [Deltaproteobacteria bacterium]
MRRAAIVRSRGVRVCAVLAALASGCGEKDVETRCAEQAALERAQGAMGDPAAVERCTLEAQGLGVRRISGGDDEQPSDCWGGWLGWNPFTKKCNFLGRLFQKAPAPSRVYSLAELEQDRGAQQLARVGDLLYFIEKGRVFQQAASDSAALGTYVKDSWGVRAVLAYADHLVAVQDDGDIYLWAAEKQQWVDIGNSAVKVFSVRGDLVAQTTKKQLWVYKGQPGDIVITYMPMVQRVGDVTIVTLIPLVNGHEVAFSDSGLRDVVAVAPAAGDDLTITFANGTTRLYSAVRARFPVGAE